MSDLLNKIPRYKEGAPHRPILDVPFMDELEATWKAPWGNVGGPFGFLNKVLVHKPGEEQDIEMIGDDLQLFNLPEGKTDVKKFREQHDNFVKALREHGSEVIFLEPKRPLVGTYGIPLRSASFMREHITVPGGIIICREAVAYKRGLEAFHAQRVGELGCPIIYTVHGNGVFEGSNSYWIDDKSIILATGLRGNAEGMRQIEWVLRNMGVEDIHHAQLPGYISRREHQVGPNSGYFHLDMTFGMASEGVACLYPGGVGYDTIDWLEKKGVDIVEISEEELHLCAPNLLPLAPKKCLVPGIGFKMTDELRKRGVEVVEVDLSEFAKAGGGPTCMTLPLSRI